MAKKTSESESYTTSNGALFLVGLAAGTLGSVLGYFSLQRRMDRALSGLRSAMRAEIANALASLNTATDEVVSPPASAEVSAEISDDVILLIAAAVTSYLGKSVRIHSARRVEPAFDNVNPWAQQGRAFLQASHNVAQRGR
jgi:hypothetical protein